MKHRNHLWTFLIGLLLLVLQVSPAQEKKDNLSFIFGGDYYAPKLDGVNSIYQAIESNYGLPYGKDFKSSYFLHAGIRYAPVPRQSIDLEIGGSVYRSSITGNAGETKNANYLSLVCLSGTYLVHVPVNHMSLFIGGGPGYMWMNSERTYAAAEGTSHVDGQLIQLHCVGGVEIPLPVGALVSIEVGYSYAMTVFPEQSNLDFTLKSPTVGMKLIIPIAKI